MKGGKGRYTKTNVWDRAAKLELWRMSVCFNPVLEKLDPGINYFVAMLDQLGAKTTFSCEGHPGGVYVMFGFPYSKIQKIKESGYFSVEVEGKNYWSIRINRQQSENERIDCLRWAAEAWEKRLGPLDWKKIRLGGKS